MSADEHSPPPRWPDVPACYGWLSLDRRGRWRLQGAPISHAGLRTFIDRHYRSDAGGRWFVANGPQQVFVELEYTPWILRLEIDGGLRTHTGDTLTGTTGVHLDEDGNVLLETAAGPGLLDDRDLSAFVADCRDAAGAAATAEAIAAAMGGDAVLTWRGLPVRPIARADVPARFGFVPTPTA
ncbi:MAG TPA: DUF2946 family protein [Rhodocyclaceae bacterium]|nr:DUF2946 family protein [Rhodocyclaceae bacterium]